MENFTANLEEGLELVEPYFSRIWDALVSSYQATNTMKDRLLEEGVVFTMTPKSKGCIMSDVLPHYLSKAFDGIENVKVIKLNDVAGLLFNNRAFIKFNKMDECNSPSIQQRKWYKAITNQGEELEGLPKQVIKFWAGIVPLDKQWSDIKRCSIAYYEGGTVVYSTDLINVGTKQLTIDITPAKTEKRRTRAKTNQNEQQTKAGND